MFTTILILLTIGFFYWAYTVLFPPKKKETFEEKVEREHEEYIKERKRDQEEQRKNRERNKYRSYTSGYTSPGYTSDYESFITSCINDMKKDFESNPYVDKIDVQKSNYLFIYNFEDGRRVGLSTNLLLSYLNYSDVKTIQIKMSEASLFMEFIKNMADVAYRRPNQKYKDYDFKSKFNSDGSSRYSYRKTDEYDTYSKRYTKPEPKINYTDEQLKYQELFKKLKEVNDRRMEQLNKMSKTDPDRVALVNEVNVVKRKMKSAFEKSGLEIKK